VTSSWFFLSTLNYDARSTTRQNHHSLNTKSNLLPHFNIRILLVSALNRTGWPILPVVNPGWFTGTECLEEWLWGWASGGLEGVVMAEDKHEPRLRWLYCVPGDGAVTTVNACTCCYIVGNISRMLKRVKDQLHLGLSSDRFRSCRHFEGLLLALLLCRARTGVSRSSPLWNFRQNSTSFLFSFYCVPSDVLSQA